ncbi:hypothetical protein PVAP13_4NG118700 [Panicum virgatum]|uniref:Uncharacterized protein n=1 Tax=Panicum virgatum TaxID=38727 RepID=A0A8T0TAD1_PANVG|nr:hypothetical protein PVAP13_4NG118700 [Panicum virgatum]
MSPPPRALPKSPKVLRTRPPRVCCFSPRSHPEPRVAARPVLLSQIHPTSPPLATHQSWRPGSNRRPPFRGAAPLPAHCSSPKSTPPRIRLPFTGAGDRAAPPAAASRSRRIDPRESRRRAAHRSNCKKCGTRRRLQAARAREGPREPARALCSHPCGGPPRRRMLHSMDYGAHPFVRAQSASVAAAAKPHGPYRSPCLPDCPSPSSRSIFQSPSRYYFPFPPFPPPLSWILADPVALVVLDSYTYVCLLI